MGIRHPHKPPGLMSAATDRRILALLVRARMSLRRQRRDNSFYHRLAVTGRNPRATLEAELASLLPPRRDWPTPGIRARRRATQLGIDPVAVTLTDWLLSQLSTPKRRSPAWLKRLRRFLGLVRTRVRDWRPESTFPAPSVHALPKTRACSKGEADSFRCVTAYRLADRIVISIAARYLRELTDPLMDAGSLAFRTESPPITHHDAIERILAFREKHFDKELWVAEVDIRGFFDVVSHDEARKAVSVLLDRLPTADGVDERALRILTAYLSSYSFNHVGRDQALAQARRHQRSGYGIDVPWPESALRDLGVDTRNTAIGVPQGGALSCFLANAILDIADRAVRDAIDKARRDPSEALYLRYCDDIICLSSSRDTCERMVNAYAEALRVLKLPAHGMVQFERAYKSRREGQTGGFWKGKSKAPYKWGPAGKSASVPWCGFVGYHVRYDGILRVRPSSIKKEVEKQHHILGQVQRYLRRTGQPRSKRQIVYRFRQRLRSIAVGTRTSRGGASSPRFCWTQGFRLLAKQPALAGQLRNLDRHRMACVARLSRGLRSKGIIPAVRTQSQILKFEGFPFSYASVVERRGKGLN